MKKLIPGCKVWFFGHRHEEIISIKNGEVTYKYGDRNGGRALTAPTIKAYFGNSLPLKIEYPFKKYLDAI